MQCEAIRDAMLDVLYGEADAATTRRVEAHQASCADCRSELAGFQRLRRDLGAWSAPDTLRRPAAPARLSWGRVAMAASLLLAIGAAVGLSGAEARFENGGLAFRVGRGGGDLESLLARQETRHRREIEALKTALGSAQAPAHSDAALLEQVGRLIEDSEQRQAARLNTRLAGFAEDVEAQRRYDLAQVGAGLSYLEGKTGLQMARTTELMGHVLKVSQQR